MTIRRLLVPLIAVVAGFAVYSYVTEEKPAWYERMRYPLSYAPIIRGHARNYDLDPALLAAVIYQESKFRANSRSSSGAIGLMQLVPDTARGIAIRTGGSAFRTGDLLNPEINVRYGCWYLRHLLNKYEGDVRKALAAYNGGQGNVDRGVEYPETTDYVRKVLELRDVYARTYDL